MSSSLACCSSTQTQSEKISSAKSPAQISLIVLGVLLIIAGITATSLLYPQTGNIALSSLAGTVIGIALIAIGSVCKARPTSHMAKIGTFSFKGHFPELTNGSTKPIQISRIVVDGQSTVVLVCGEVEEGMTLGKNAPVILSFSSHHDHDAAPLLSQGSLCDLQSKSSLHATQPPASLPTSVSTKQLIDGKVEIRIFFPGVAARCVFDFSQPPKVDVHGQRYLIGKFKGFEGKPPAQYQ